MIKILEFLILITESSTNFLHKIGRFFSALRRKITLRRIEQTVIVLLLLVFIGSGILVGVMIFQFESLKDIRALDDYSVYELPTEVYDRNGKKITDFFLYKRVIVPYSEFPRHLMQALIATEDQNFYEHTGIDPWGVFRAMIQNIISGRIVQGGSTLTQQLAKRLFTGGEKTFFRKFNELWYTVQIEKKFTKAEIIEKYLNQIYFGHNTYGAEAACQYYFGKSVRNITPAESAILISLPSAPVTYSPIRYPDNARRKQQIVLSKMVRKKFISKQEAAESFEEFWINFESRLITNSFRSAWQDRLDLAPYWSEYIRQQLMQIFQGQELYTGGYKVYTTLDINLQKLALQLVQKRAEKSNQIYKKNTQILYDMIRTSQAEVMDFIGLSFGEFDMNFREQERNNEFIASIRNEILDSIELVSYLNGAERLNTLLEKFRIQQYSEEQGEKPQGALVSMNVKNGHILAMVGGTGFTQTNQLNRAHQARRQPGSAFKPYVYLTALLSRRFTAASTIKDEPLVYRDNTGAVWMPENAGGGYVGTIRLRDALRRSVNIVSVKLVEALTPETIMKMATLVMNVPNPERRFRYDLSIGLGTNEISPYEMMVGFSTFATLGKRVKPISITRITDRNGRIIRNFEEENMRDPENGRQIIPEAATFLLVDMMKDVVKEGTASGAAQEAQWTKIAAGKTGTTQFTKDAWFVGFTPDIATAVWFGFDSANMSLGPEQYGGDVAAPVWFEFMKEATRDIPNNDWKNPGGLKQVKVTKRSGLLVHRNSTDEVYSELFLPNTEPTEVDMEWQNDIVRQEQIERIDPLREERERTLHGENRAPDMSLPSQQGGLGRNFDD